MKNPYIGINAHLNSILQTPATDEQPATWPGFHAAHIINLMEALNAVLPENYAAIGEHSLQSQGEDDAGVAVTVFRQGKGTALAEQALVSPSWEAKLEATIDPEDLMSAIVVRELTEQSRYGIAVLRIELLSPSNKFDGRHYSAYRSRRNEALESTVPLVEIDYLHESISPIMGLPRYPHEPKSYPYTLAIHDNRKGIREGITQVFGWKVGQKLPQLSLPLDDDKRVMLDFEPVYQHTYEHGRWGRLLDLSQEPPRMETYHEDDSVAIRAVMS
jgi:hypothetical protein